MNGQQVFQVLCHYYYPLPLGLLEALDNSSLLVTNLLRAAAPSTTSQVHGGQRKKQNSRGAPHLWRKCCQHCGAGASN